MNREQTIVGFAPSLEQPRRSNRALAWLGIILGGGVIWAAVLYLALA